MSPVSGRLWRWRRWIASLILTVGLFGYLLSQIDLGELLATARGIAPGYLAIFVALLLAGVAARALRFWVLLDRAVSPPLLAGITLVRNLFIDLLPARLGELAYVYLLTVRARRPIEEGVASLLLAFLFDLVALAPLLVVAVVIVGGGATLPTEWLVAGSALLAVGAYVAIRVMAPVARGVARRLPAASRATGRRGAWLAALATKLEETGDVVDAAHARGVFVPVLLLSAVVRATKFGSYYFLVLAIMTPLGYTAAGLGVFRVFLGVVGAELAAALPIHGVGGFGTFEAVWALSFAQLGFSREHAIMSGILAHAISQLVEYTLGACAMLVLLRPGWQGGRRDD